MKSIVEKIKFYHKKKTLLYLTSGFLNLIVLLSIIWISTLFLDMIFYFSITTRWIVLFLNGSLSIYLFYRFVLSHIYRFYKTEKDKNYLYLTNEIGAQLPKFSDRLTNMYQLENLDVPKYSENLRKYASEKFAKEIRSYNFIKDLKFRNYILPISVILSVLLSSIFTLVLLNEPLLLSFKRIIIPYKSFSSVPEYLFNVSPGSKSIIKGDSELIKVKYSGPKLSSCIIQFKNDSEQYWQPKQMEFQNYSYMFQMEKISENINYRIKGIVEQNKPWADKIVSPIFNINAITPPALSNLQVVIFPPKYTKLEMRYLENNVGDVLAYKGSTIEISANANKKLQKADIVFLDNQKFPMKIRENKITSKFIVDKNKNYLFNILDIDSIYNQNPIEYTITILEDYYPSINIIEPEEDIESIPDAVLNLKIEGSDDFGFSDVKLHYKILNNYENTDTSYVKIDLPFALSNIKNFTQTHFWNLSELPIGFDESIKYFVSIKDNDNVNGYKESRSKFHFIRFPSLEKLFEEFSSEEDKNIKELEDLSESNKELKKELEKIRREIKQDKKIDWERKKQIESSINKQDQIQKKMNDIEKEIEKAIKKLADKNLFSPEILQKYSQLQELFNEIATPELLESMKELQKSLDSLEKKKVEEALNKMSINQEQFKEKLERTLELFKKIQLEQEMDRLVQLADILNKKQKKYQKIYKMRIINLFQI